MLRAGCASRPDVLKYLISDGVGYNLRRGFHQLTARSSSSSEVSTPYWELKKDKLSDAQTWRLIRREIHAVIALRTRSGFSDATGSKFLLFNGNLGFHTSQNRQQNENKNENKNDKDSNKMNYGIIALLGISVAVLLGNVFSIQNVEMVSWHDFVHHMLAKGEVREIVVDAVGGRVLVHLQNGAIYKDKPALFRAYSLNVDVDQIESKLREVEEQLGIRYEDAVPVVFQRSNTFIGPLISVLLILGLIGFLSSGKWSLSNLMQNNHLTKANFTLVTGNRGSKGVKFSDIAGLKEAKREVMEFVDYLKNPDRYCQLGAKVPKGTLLLGPPGCGKTLLAKAVATESNVPFLSMNGSEFNDMIGGVGASRVRNLFKEAAKKAPCIIYIDEIDALGRKRTNSGQSGNDSDQTLNQLLVELDGMVKTEGIITLASTNRSDILDKALMRPGRFDRHILIDVPTCEERKEMFEMYLKSMKFEEPPTSYSRDMALRTPGFTGADIANICNEAALHAARLQKENVQQSDLEYAVDRVLFGAERKTDSRNIETRQEAAFYLAGSVVVGWFLEHTDALLKVSLLPRGNHNLGHSHFSKSERYLVSNYELYDRMAMILGGKAAEELIHGHSSTMCENDSKIVKDIAYRMVEVFGMNETVGMLSFTREPYKKRIYSRNLQAIIDLEVRKLLTKSYDTASNILKEHEDELKLIARELLKKDTLSYDDVCALIGPPPHGHKKQVNGIDFGAQANEKSSYADDPPSEQESSSYDKSKTATENVKFL